MVWETPQTCTLITVAVMENLLRITELLLRMITGMCREVKRIFRLSMMLVDDK